MIDRPYKHALQPWDRLDKCLLCCHAVPRHRVKPSPSLPSFGRPKCQPKTAMSLVHHDDNHGHQAMPSSISSPLSSYEAWDSMGSMSMDTIQTITVHHPQPRSRLCPQATRATNLRVLLHDMRVGTGQVLHMPGQPYHKVYQACR